MILTQFLDDEERTYLRTSLLEYINRVCVFRTNPEVQYVPGIPKGTIPSSVPGKFSTWQLYLRRLTQDGDMMAAASMLLLDEFAKNGEPMLGLQLAGLETSSIPLISFFQGYARSFQRKYNTFSVRKERKGYGIFNFIDGVPNRNPVVVMDDIVNSGSSFFRVLDTSLYELDLDPHTNAYFIMNLDPKTGARVFNGTTVKLNALFNKNDLDTAYDPEKYWLPEDVQRSFNSRPDYR